MDPNNTHEVIFWDNLYKLRPWLLDEKEFVTYCVNFPDCNLCKFFKTTIAKKNP